MMARGKANRASSAGVHADYAQVSVLAGGGTGAGELALALVAALVDAVEGAGDNRLQLGNPTWFLLLFRIHRDCCSDVNKTLLRCEMR